MAGVDDWGDVWADSMKLVDVDFMDGVAATLRAGLAPSSAPAAEQGQGQERVLALVAGAADWAAGRSGRPSATRNDGRDSRDGDGDGGEGDGGEGGGGADDGEFQEPTPILCGGTNSRSSGGGAGKATLCRSVLYLGNRKPAAGSAEKPSWPRALLARAGSPRQTKA